jgi:hypothetical protein
MLIDFISLQEGRGRHSEECPQTIQQNRLLGDFQQKIIED